MSGLYMAGRSDVDLPQRADVLLEPLEFTVEVAVVLGGIAERHAEKTECGAGCPQGVFRLLELVESGVEAGGCGGSGSTGSVPDAVGGRCLNSSDAVDGSRSGAGGGCGFFHGWWVGLSFDGGFTDGRNSRGSGRRVCAVGTERHPEVSPGTVAHDDGGAIIADLELAEAD